MNQSMENRSTRVDELVSVDVVVIDMYPKIVSLLVGELEHPLAKAVKGATNSQHPRSKDIVAKNNK